jgi:hypothetical protein
MQGSLPAGWLAFTGRELNPLDRDEGITSSSSLPGLFLAQRPQTSKESAGDRARRRVRRYGDCSAGGVLPESIERLVGEAIEGVTIRSTGQDRGNRRRAAEIERQDGNPLRCDGEHGHCQSRAGEAEAHTGMSPQT